MTNKFAHLHNHTLYSLLDGAAKMDEMVKAAADDGQPGLAITDHGVLYGLIDFYRACKKYDVNPVLGIESYFCDDRFEKSKVRAKGDSDIDGSDKRYYHLTVLAENNTGYQNLLKLSSDSYMEGFYYKPRADWELLERYSSGLIATSGCLGGPVLQSLLYDRFDEALEKAARLQDIFGKDSFFIELQDHGLVEQKRTNPDLVKISRLLDAPLVAANDCHYVHAEDSVAHDSLLCIQTGARIEDTNRFKFQSDQHYLKTSDEMRRLFADFPEACDNTVRIAERADISIDFTGIHLPVYEPPTGFSGPTQYLAELAHQGLLERRGGSPTHSDYERLAYELATIDTLGLSSYFLIVWDLVKFADKIGCRRGAARGSVAGSLVAYALDISRVDPIRHNLIFERFINPSRVAMADIDLDFDTRYRDNLIAYTREKYGNDRVAQIITFQKIRARAAVRDAARVLGFEPSVGSKISKAMPPLMMGESTPLKYCFEEVERYKAGFDKASQLRSMYKSEPDVQAVVDVAMGLEDLVRQDGIHAAAVVITPTKLTDYIPVQKKPLKNGDEGPLTTQYEKNTIEDLGLLKMDYLGLRNLDVISECLEIIGSDPGIDETTFDDEKTFDLLRAGDTVGVFQLESKPMRALLERLRPNSIDDIAAVVALYRPGPMSSNMHNDYADRKNGRQAVEYFHSDAEPILSTTYGLCIYQEQIMEITKTFAGYTMTEADNVRKIIGKKLRDKMLAEREKFTQGCVDNGYSLELATSIFDMIEGFASYSFNASHAYGYGYISYQTAFLKAHYPKEYMAALCSSVSSKIEKTTVFLAEARAMGMDVHTPSINKSRVDFTADADGIRVGLSAIANIGGSVSGAIVNERNQNGHFTSLIDFVERVKPNAKNLESLAFAGALDEFGTRLGIASVSKEILENSRKAKKKVLPGQNSMFDTETLWTFEVPKTEFPPMMKLEHERKAIGIYVSGHPLDDQQGKTDWMMFDVLQLELGQEADVLVHVVNVNEKITRNGQKMALMTMSDQTGLTDEVVCFPHVYAKVSLREGDIGTATLKAGTNYEDKRNFIVQDFVSIRQQLEELDVAEHKIFLPEGFAQDEVAVSKLKGLLLSHHGGGTVALYVSHKTRLELSDDFRVKWSEGLENDLRDLFKSYSNK